MKSDTTRAALKGAHFVRALAISCACTALAVTAGEAITINDGGTHVLNTSTSEPYMVQNGSTLQVTGGSHSGSFVVEDGSSLVIDDGQFGGPNLRDGTISLFSTSSLVINGGQFGSFGGLTGCVYAYPGISLTITGGSFGSAGSNTGRVLAYQGTSLTITGGSFGSTGNGSGNVFLIPDDEVYGNGHVEAVVSGGIFRATGPENPDYRGGQLRIADDTVIGSAAVSISGGTFTGSEAIWMNGPNTTMEITGGAYRATITVGSATATISGGEFGDDPRYSRISAYLGGGFVTFAGSCLEVTQINPTNPYRVLVTGFLADGAALELHFIGVDSTHLTLDEVVVCPDTDGDGVLDVDDACIDSDLRPTIWIDLEDTGVENDLLEDGCTLADLISALLAEDPGTAEVVALLLEWKAEGIISGQEMGSLVREINSP